MQSKEKLKELLEALLRNMGVSYDAVVVEEKEGVLYIDITSSEAELLIGVDGATLAALTHLVRRISSGKSEEPVSIQLDINGYKRAKDERIQREARALGEQVLRTKNEAVLSPMGPYERLLVHGVFADHPLLKTESRGEGPTRHVVIVLRS